MPKRKNSLQDDIPFFFFKGRILELPFRGNYSEVEAAAGSPERGQLTLEEVGGGTGPAWRKSTPPPQDVLGDPSAQEWKWNGPFSLRSPSNIKSSFPHFCQEERSRHSGCGQGAWRWRVWQWTQGEAEAPYSSQRVVQGAWAEWGPRAGLPTGEHAQLRTKGDTGPQAPCTPGNRTSRSAGQSSVMGGGTIHCFPQWNGRK